ncbi:hypothetical protein D1165_07770 [Muribaculaceae bacterium M3]|nr:hypothetical protein [Muribaculaceae bacterium M3]
MNRVLKYLSGVRRNGKRRPSLDRKNRRSDAASYGNGRSSSQRYSVSAYNPNIRAAIGGKYSDDLSSSEHPRFAVGGRSARASGEQQSAAWGGGELPISLCDIDICPHKKNSAERPDRTIRYLFNAAHQNM